MSTFEFFGCCLVLAILVFCVWVVLHIYPSNECINSQPEEEKVLSGNALEEAYIKSYAWAADTHGVKENAFDRWVSNGSDPENYQYYTVYFVCNRQFSKPNCVPELNTVVSNESRGYKCHNVEEFMREFVEAVDEMKDTVEYDKLLFKYNVSTVDNEVKKRFGLRARGFGLRNHKIEY